MPKRLAETEQRGFHGGFGVEDSSLILGMRIGLMRHQEPRSGNDATGSGVQRRRGCLRRWRFRRRGRRAVDRPPHARVAESRALASFR